MSQSQPEKDDSPRLLKSSGVVSSMTLLSRILGLARDVVLARLLGATANADAFFVAFKIPNFLRRLFSEGAFAQAFVPVLAQYREDYRDSYREGGVHEAVKALLDRVAGCLGSVLVALTVLAVVGAPAITAIFAPGFWSSAEKFSLTSDMIRITFPYLMLISLTGFAGAILNSYDRFAVPAFTPVLLNISLITAALVFAPMMDEPVFALAWGVLIAGCLQLGFQVPFLWRLRLMPRPKPDWQDPVLKKYWR